MARSFHVLLLHYDVYPAENSSISSGLRFSQPVIQGKILCHFEHLITDPLQFSRVGPMFESLRDPACNNAHFGLLHSPRRQGWGADSDAAGLHWGVGVVWNCVLVDRDSSLS